MLSFLLQYINAIMLIIYYYDCGVDQASNSSHQYLD